MNLDDKPEFVLANQHIHALNIRLYGGANGLTAQNIPGNTLIANSLPAGDNQALGSCYDGLRQRIFWQNWNSNARNGLYMYTISTGVITALLVSFTNSQTDIFGFDLDYPIASQNIIYTTEEDGDIWTWTARNDRPKELNILDALNNIYGANWLASYLDVEKSQPTIPIHCGYENDTAVTVNNLKGSGGYKLIRAKYRFWYGTFQKSCWSTISEMPIPVGYTDQAIDTDQTKNCRIGMIFQTGSTDTVKIEIAVQENLGDIWGKFFSVQILDKAELSIPNNDTYIWAFYNNEAYDYIDEAESILQFDRVPIKANTQELLNGNVIIYGGITEGYDPVIPDVTITSETQDISAPTGGISVLATQQGFNGLSTGNIRISLAGTPIFPTAGIGITGTASFVRVTVFNGTTPLDIICQALVDNTTLAVLIAQLSASATGQGFTVVSTTSNSIVISHASQVLMYYYSGGNGRDQKPIGESVPANDFSSKYDYALAYFAEKSKTNGATTSEDFNVSIFPITMSPNAYNFSLSNIQLKIYHRPPTWSKYYQVLRTNNLTKEDFVSLVSDRTFKDADFAYISIEALARYKIQYPTTVISYDFLVGDRIKFCALFNNDKTIAQIYGNAHDYEIVGQVDNPNINGLVNGGRFVKIKLPTTGATFDFGSFTSNSYYYYYIQLYTPAKSVANNLNVYYEFGEMFEIGNSGSATLAFHQGNFQNQATDLSAPAIINLRKGDAYFRPRDIRAGAFFLADTVKDITYSWVNEPVYEQTIENIPVGTTYTVKNTTSGNTSNLNNWLIKTGLVAVNFNVKGKLIFKSLLTTASNISVILQIKNVGGGGVSLVALSTISGASNGQILEFNIDQNVTIPASKTAVIYLQESPVSSPTPFSASSISGQLTFIDTEHDFLIGVIDPNFSDFFASKVNSNGREFVVNPDEKQIFYSTLLRWGLSYQQNTNINQINRFFPANFDEIDRSKGAIQRLKTRDRILRVFQNRACGQFGVYARFIQNNQGQSELVTTDDIITKNNISYYEGEYGVGEQYTALVSGKIADYFDDSVRGYECRLSGNGITPISELYKGEFTIRNYITPYNKTNLRTDGSKAKILKTFNYFDEEAITLLQATATLPGYCFSFNEKRNGYCTFHSFKDAEWLQDFEDNIAMWKDGQLWVLNIGNPDPSTPYCNYFGVQYDASITVVFNVNLLEKKTPESLSEIASAIWACPVIYSNVMSYGTQRQETMLGTYDFATLEGVFEAAILRDSYSINGINNGDWMKANWLVVQFIKESASELISLAEVSLMWKDSPLTNK